MIRPFTLLCFAAFAFAGAWLYQVKHKVAMQDRELVEIRRQTEQARQRLDILRAEWALVNEPDRLRQTASRVLSLEPMQPQHFARATDLDRRLPASVAFAGAPNLFAIPPAPEPPRGAQPPVMLAAAPAAPIARAVQPAASAPPQAQAPAIRVPEAPAPQALAAALAAQRAEQASRIAAPAPRPAPAPQAAPPPRPVQPAVHVTPVAPPSDPVTRMTRAAPPETPVTSALGGASALGRPVLAPPVPVGTAAAATLAPPAFR